MKKSVNVHEAKTQFSRLLRRVAVGEEINISNRGKVVARLVPAQRGTSGKGFAMCKGKFVVPADFDRALPDALLDLFEGQTKRKRSKP